eukprot:1832906-Pleurochrysis_carterae.AAC.1
MPPLLLLTLPRKFCLGRLKQERGGADASPFRGVVTGAKQAAQRGGDQPALRRRLAHRDGEARSRTRAARIRTRAMRLRVLQHSRRP